MVIIEVDERQQRNMLVSSRHVACVKITKSAILDPSSDSPPPASPPNLATLKGLLSSLSPQMSTPHVIASSSGHHSVSTNNGIVGGHYKVGKKIGEGSFGVVFEGTYMSPRSCYSALCRRLSWSTSGQWAC
jgi:hypothetical protein